MNTLKPLLLTLCGLSLLSGCATTQPPFVIDAPNTEQKSEKRMGRTLLTLGGLLLVGAIVANEARDGAQDAIRGANLPR